MSEIQELESIASKTRKTFASHGGTTWSDDETDTVARYYNRVPMKVLQKYLPNRTPSMIRSKFQQMKIGKKYSELISKYEAPHD